MQLGKEYLELIQEIYAFITQQAVKKDPPIPLPALSLTSIAAPQTSLQPEPVLPQTSITIVKKEEKKVGPFSLVPLSMPHPLDTASLQLTFPKAAFFAPIVICYFQEKEREFAAKLAYALTLQKRFATCHQVDNHSLIKEIQREWPFVLTFTHSALLPFLPKNFSYHIFYPRKIGDIFLLHPIEEYEQNGNSKRNLWTKLLSQLPPSS